jgi:superfamily II DNA/RNA helicase
MVADTPYILDEECKECPKLEELENIFLDITVEKDAKIIVFSEWERMLFLVRELAEKLNLRYAWHTGSVPQLQRREEIRRFKEDSECRLFLTTDSGSTGLNLQVANVVINLDIPWNPAKLEQRIARAWRKNQTRAVQVINLVTEDTIEQRMLSMLTMKQAVADAVLDAVGDLSEMALPSASSQAFIDKMEQLTGQTLPSSPSSDQEMRESTPENIVQDLLARHTDRIHLVELHQNAAFAVVDKVDSEIQQNLSQITSDSVEVIDFDTYMTLQRLVEAGVLQFGTGTKSLLFQSQLIQKDRRTGQQQKLERATAIFKEAERKLTMVQLLKSGGFTTEALPTAFEAFHKGMEVLEILHPASTPTTSQLKEQINNVENPDQFIDTLFRWMEEISTLKTQYALGV